MFQENLSFVNLLGEVNLSTDIERAKPVVYSFECTIEAIFNGAFFDYMAV